MPSPDEIKSINAKLCEGSIIVTLPKSVPWSDYELELAKVANGDEVMFFKVSNFPRKLKEFSKCYVVHEGVVKGWLRVVGYFNKSFTCSTTGKKWTGKFIGRSGEFHKVEEIPYKGFQGWRYYND